MFKKVVVTVFVLFAVFFGTLAVLAADNIKVFNLKNGHTVVIKEVHTNPIVTIDTWVKTGSANENDTNNGVAHFLEHLFFKGTKSHPQGEFEKILDGKGGVYNAATSKDFTHFYITIASQYFDTALDLHSDMLLNPAIPVDDLNRERKVVQEEIGRAKDNPSNILYENLNSILFKKHPYKRTVLGTADIIGSISREEIFNFYHNWYNPSNMITVIVGDVDTDSVLAKVQQKFAGKYTDGRQVKIARAKEPYLTQKTEKVQKGDYGTGYMMIGFRGVPANNKKESYALDLAAEILGSGRSSRLYQEIKEKNHLATSISAGHMSMKDDSIFYISAEFEPQNYEKLKASINEEIKKLRETPVSASELKKARTLLQRGFVYSNESTSNVANSIGYTMTIGENIEDYTKYIEGINKITAEDIQKVANKYLLDTRMAISTLLPEKNEKPVANVQDKYQDVEKRILSNGINLITEKIEPNEIVSLSVFVKGGKFIETIPGISSVVTGKLLKGTQNRSAIEIANELENSGIIIAPSANPDYFEIQLKSTKQDFDKAFAVLKDIIENPAFKSEYVEKVKKEIIQDIKSSRDNPSSVVFEEFNLARYAGHPYGYTGKVLEESVPKITRENVVSFYNKFFSPQNMIVSVAGDFDKQDIIDKFSSITVKPDAQKVDINALIKKYNTSAITSNKLIPVKKDTSTGWLVMGWSTAGMVNEKDFAVLNVINSIIGRGMSSRLFSNLREKQGLAYEVSSAYPSRLDESSFVMYIGTKPQNLELAKNQFLQEISRIIREPVSEKELADAKQNIIGKYALSQETGGEKAHVLGWYEVIGKGYKFNYDYPSLINSVTAQDILNVASKYFSNPNIVSVIGPEKYVEVVEKGYNLESKR